MLLIIFCMLGGILLGFAVISRETTGRLLKIFGRIQQITTAVLLFMMGIWLGANPQFWQSLAQTGLHGFLFALITIAASCLMVYFFARIAFVKKRPHKEEQP